jgi:hypothetical protein
MKTPATPRGALLAAVLTSAAFGLAGCGGDDGGGAPAPTPPGPITTYGDASATVGKSAGVAVGSGSTAFVEASWTQTGGPATVVMSAPKTQAFSFEPPAVGTYTFAVTTRDGAGTVRTANFSVTAAAAPATSTVNVRADRAVRKGGTASLRAWPQLAAGDGVASVSWTQIEGPTVTLNTSDPNRILFTAPNVAWDTVLRFRATMRFASGATDTDEALVLVENVEQAPGNSTVHIFEGLHVSRVYAYRANGPFASALQRCVYAPDLQYTGNGKNLCPLSTLPFLHQTTGGQLPSIDQVMDRVVVSHDWQGEVFQQFLQTNDVSGDIRRLLNGVTAIVIGADVRPSFYYAVTGAIYLDADNFWLTPAQRDVINETPDFRSDFDKDLGYSGLWRYTRNSMNIFLPFAPNARISRSVGYLLDETAWLMYHELGHANDFLPTSVRGALNNTLNPWDNIGPRVTAAQLPSDGLTATTPLTSQANLALGRVKFQIGPQPAGTNVSVTYNGSTFTIPYATLTGYNPTQVGNFFSADRASDEYAYSSIREDLAMLFEEFMMFHNHGIRRDVAITDKITATSTGNTVLVRWGQRGRAGEVAVRPRVQSVVSNLAPWVIAANANAVNNLPAPIAMRAGDSWNGNLVLPAPPPGTVSTFNTRLFDPLGDAMLLERAARRSGPWLVTQAPPAKPSRWDVHGPKLPNAQ